MRMLGIRGTLCVLVLVAATACGTADSGGSPAPQDVQTIQDTAPDSGATASVDVAADVGPDVPETPADVSNLPLIPSDQGTFAALLLRTPEPPTPSGGKLELTLLDTGGVALAGAKIKATPWMPAMGHGSPKVPVVVDDGGGHYTITNLLFSMPGKWQLRVDVTTADSQDRFTLAYTIQ